MSTDRIGREGGVPRRRAGSELVAAIVMAGGLLPPTVQAFQASPSAVPPSFSSQVSAITVDAVVLDKSGAPVRGLTRDDFIVLEDGQPQVIVGFEARTLEGTPPADALRASLPPAVGANLERGARRGRTLLILIDDLGLTAVTAQQVKATLARWLETPDVANDELTLLTTSGDIGWADTIGPGRADFLAVLERLRGKRENRSRADLTMTDEEAAQIVDSSASDSGGDSQGGGGGAASGPPSQLGPALQGASSSVFARVVRRWQDGGCAGGCEMQVRAMANEIDLGKRRRLDLVLTTLARLARTLAPTAGRKSILVLGESFSRDENMEARYREVIDAAQRGNTSVYFTAAGGLLGSSGYSADSRTAPVPGDLGRMSVEENLLAFAGAAQITEATGGTMTATNDLAAGLGQMVSDLSAYYLIGYQPPPGAAGKWHDLQVKVNRPGVTVRARRRYRSGPPAAERAPKGDKAKRAIQSALTSSLASAARDAIPLRMALSLQEPDGKGGAHVQVVVEADGSVLQPQATGTGGKASLDLTILAVARDKPTVMPLQETIDIGLRPNEAGGWWALFRELRLPPGVTQVRTTLRDRTGGATGTVTARIEVPAVDEPYLSTPFLTDRTQPPLAKGEPPRLVPTALRRFTRGRPLYCQYELFGFGGRQMRGVPQIVGGYTLLAADGRILESVAPTLIGTDGRRVVRRIALRTSDLPPGAYELRIDVEDRLAKRAFSARESFVLEAEP